MFSVKVHNPFIYQNIITLVEMLKSQKIANERHLKLSCYCNPKTGELFDPSSLLAGLITIALCLDMDQRAITWQPEEGKFLSSTAQARLTEMANILKKTFINIERLGQLTHLDWKGRSNQVNDNQALKEALYDISREEAEQILLKQPVGTYLFRRDRYALELQEVLKKSLKRSIRCYTLTYLDFERIIRERTLVFYNYSWIFYDDDPTLSGTAWDSMTDLLKSLKSTLKYPLPLSRAAQG